MPSTDWMYDTTHFTEIKYFARLRKRSIIGKFLQENTDEKFPSQIKKKIFIQKKTRWDFLLQTHNHSFHSDSACQGLPVDESLSFEFHKILIPKTFSTPVDVPLKS